MGSVNLLCHFNGSGTARPVDSARNFIFSTGNANAQQSATRPVFGTNAGELLATGFWEIGSSQNLSLLDFGSGDFTIRGRFTVDSLSSARTLVSLQAGTTNANRVWRITIAANGTLTGTIYTANLVGGFTSWDVSSSAGAVTTGGGPYALSFERSGDTLYLYLNGTRVASTALTAGVAINAVSPSSQALHFGTEYAASQTFVGMVDEWYFNKGTSLAAGASSYTVETVEFDDPPSVATGFLSFNAGTPAAGLIATGFQSFHAGTPSVAFIPPGFRSFHAGTPTWHGVTRHQAASVGQISLHGTPTTPTERYVQALGLLATHVGDPVAVRFVTPLLDRLAVASSVRVFRAGTPSATGSVAANASGLHTAHFGAAAASTTVAAVADGLAPAGLFGTPAAVRRQRASGFLAARVGTPGSPRFVQATGAAPHTHYGTPTYSRGANTHYATSAGVRARFGQPKGFPCRVTYPGGFSAFHAGVPGAVDRHRASALGPTFRAGTPLALRNPEC